MYKGSLLNLTDSSKYGRPGLGLLPYCLHMYLEPRGLNLASNTNKGEVVLL